MNEENQIEEMAKVYDEARLKASETLGSMNKGEAMWYSEAFYKAGYRKASYVAEDIIRILRAAGMNEYRYPVIAEIKKKYIAL